MQLNLENNGHIRGLLFALGGAVIAAVVTMFIPIAILEGLIGSVGISEIIPAAAAPLGDTARAAIAFVTGVFAFAAIAFVTMRQGSNDHEYTGNLAASLEKETVSEEGNSLFSAMKSKMAAFVAARRGQEGVTELSDLPRLRNRDVHPDAPARRPISAALDLGEFSEQHAADNGSINRASIEENEEEIASLADMVAQLEATILQREEQLSRLHSLAEQLVVEQEMKNQAQASAPQIIMPEANRAAPIAAAAEPIMPEPHLHAVETAPQPQKREQEDMDAALRSALETLHKMNARSG